MITVHDNVARQYTDDTGCVAIRMIESKQCSASAALYIARQEQRQRGIGQHSTVRDGDPYGSAVHIVSIATGHSDTTFHSLVTPVCATCATKLLQHLGAGWCSLY